MFDTVNKNNDKTINKKELNDLLDKLNKTKLSSDKLDEIFKNLDSNKDGEIDFKEFKIFLQNTNNGDYDEPGQPSNSTIAENTKWKEHADKKDIQLKEKDDLLKKKDDLLKKNDDEIKRLNNRVR